MHYPLSALGPAAIAAADPAWMSPDAATTILEMLPRLPDIASTVGFEIRLTGDDRRVGAGQRGRRSADRDARHRRGVIRFVHVGERKDRFTRSRARG